MTARRGAFPFASAPYINAAQQVRGLYQVQFTAQQALDSFLNVDSYAVEIECFPSLTDTDIAFTELAAMSTIGGYFGAAMLLDYGAAWYTFLSTATSVTGKTVRVPCPATNYSTATPKNPQGLPYALCRDLCFMDIFKGPANMLIIDWGATVRQQLGRKTQLLDFIYMPQVTYFGFLGGAYLSNDVMMLSGAGNTIGGITFEGASTGISTVNALLQSGTPVGTPSLEGNGLSIASRYDALKWETQGGRIIFSGVPFTDVPGDNLEPAEGLFLGGIQTTFATNSDGSISAVIPRGFTKGYAEFRSTSGNYWSSREPVEVS